MPLPAIDLEVGKLILLAEHKAAKVFPEYQGMAAENENCWVNVTCVVVSVAAMNCNETTERTREFFPPLHETLMRGGEGAGGGRAIVEQLNEKLARTRAGKLPRFMSKKFTSARWPVNGYNFGTPCDAVEAILFVLGTVDAMSGTIAVKTVDGSGA